MADTLICDIVTPERKLFSAEVGFVVAPASDGEIGILPLHVPLVSTLKAGEVRITLADNAIERFAISGGYAQVQNGDKVIVLANRAVNVADIDVSAANTAVENLSMKIEGLDEGATGIEYLKSELEWAKLQVELASR